MPSAPHHEQHEDCGDAPGDNGTDHVVRLGRGVFVSHRKLCDDYSYGKRPVEMCLGNRDRHTIRSGVAIRIDDAAREWGTMRLTTPHPDAASTAASPSRRSRTNSSGISSAGKWPPASGARHRTMRWNRSCAHGRGCFSMSCG